MSHLNDLIGEYDASKWAKEFVKVAELRSDIPRDEGTMTAWFASAIMAGFDEGRKQERQRGIEDVIREIAYQCAGAGSGAIMEEAPNVIMPSEEISERVDRILMEFGIKIDWKRSSDARDADGQFDSDLSRGTCERSDQDQASASWRREENARRKAVGLEAEPDGLLRKH